ncbi:SDR family NAD(P)-dependent oxidoreductase [Marinicellulosiphila megalodicopiae]|uniref:SDR family NAD(P)-dependent oxidoreductase n=1 Tax=Marinicellulosiphila megalodicopiae TaxID=2724896 RepID=UPI003BB09E0E
MNSNTQKTVWLVGASFGLGYDSALKYHNEGWHVIISGRSKDKLYAMQTQYENMSVCVLDLLDQSSVDHAITEVFKYQVDLIILNAGDYELTPSLENNFDTFQKIMNINFLAHVQLINKSVSYLLEQTNKSTICLVGSMASIIGLPNASAYCASKAALTSYAQTLYFDFQNTNIDVKLITPGFVKTRLTDKNTFKMPMMVTSEYAADQIFKATQSNKFETVFPKRFYWMMKYLSWLPMHKSAKQLLRQA